jgi:hypothetical protein
VYWPPGKRHPRAPFAYLAFAALATLASAKLFYGYMLQQTRGEWSAPLDDVFIHFDYARAAARGYPFQWSEGNGYSSGSTSVLYPFALALGYWGGFRGPELMIWAAILAAVSVFGVLWAAYGLFRGLPRWTSALAPASLFSVGALCWSLWSGMEVAFFLGIWGACLAVALAFEDRGGRSAPLAWALGASGAALVLTRPEAATSVLVLGVFAASRVHRREGWLGALGTAARAGLPAALALAAHSLANHLLTGESSANGALVKLALHNPYMTSAEKLADWGFNVIYSFNRLTRHHFGEVVPWGEVPLVLALIPLLDRRVRARAIVLWSSAILWVLVTALNGQVRWQNERYLMPAVAWVLLSAALGVGVLVAPPAGKRRRGRAVAGAALSLALVAAFWRGERVQYRDQVWFFARASRNIRDQHTTAGRLLRTLDPPARRVLVGDAGALIYASDMPGFDLIGLGGYHDLPLARAGVHGIAATLEIIERVPAAQRPDVMAIYPSWWPLLPRWFGREIASVPVQGNVICGGAEKVIFLADWRLLDTGAAPRSLHPGERIIDEVDVADLVSERAHRYAFPSPQGGWTDMRVLPDPAEPARDLWDAGRRIPLGRPERFELRGLPKGRPVRLLIRTISDRPAAIELAAGRWSTRLALPAAEGWVEVAVTIPGEAVQGVLPVSITPREGEWVNYHMWAVAPE